VLVAVHALFHCNTFHTWMIPQNMLKIVFYVPIYQWTDMVSRKIKINWYGFTWYAREDHVIDYNNQWLGSVDRAAKITADEIRTFMYFVAGCRIYKFEKLNLKSTGGSLIQFSCANPF
jgi:hypothetical protein